MFIEAMLAVVLMAGPDHAVIRHRPNHVVLTAPHIIKISVVSVPTTPVQQQPTRVECTDGQCYQTPSRRLFNRR